MSKFGEPWRNGEKNVIETQKGEHCARSFTTYDWIGGGIDVKGDLIKARIITCVNALAGIEDPAAELARLREIGRAAQELFSQPGGSAYRNVEDWRVERSQRLEALRVVLAKGGE